MYSYIMHVWCISLAPSFETEKGFRIEHYVISATPLSILNITLYLTVLSIHFFTETNY